MTKDILVVDDEADICDQLRAILQDEGYTVRVARSSDEAEQLIAHRFPHLILLDIWLQGSPRDGIELLMLFKSQCPSLPIVMMSGHATIEIAVQAMQRGAEDVIEKPFKTEKLLHILDRVFQMQFLLQENAHLKTQSFSQDVFVGHSPFIQQLQATVAKVSALNARVFISGPPGTGKTLLARQIHRASRRKDAPFVVAHCSLFQDSPYVDQRFMGTETTDQRHVGFFEQAHGGTLFLDDVCNLPQAFQAKLVRFLQDGKFTRMGGQNPVQVDVRIMASTSRDPQEALADGSLREDLYHRLNVVCIPMLPLAQRREDVIPLAHHFMQMCAAVLGLPERPFSQDAMAALQSYVWPSNVRQLQHTIEWLLIMGTGGARDPITVDLLPKDIYETAPLILKSERKKDLMALTLRDARAVFEREYLQAQLLRHNGNISRVANNIRMERSALHRKMKSLGLDHCE
jgi:two-component system nitrogen regulation response regulator NtrX